MSNKTSSPAAPAAKSNKPKPTPISREEWQAVGYFKPNANRVQTREDALSILQELRDYRAANTLHPSSVSTLARWQRAWQRIAHTYGREFGSAPTRGKGPPAAELARKAAKRIESARIRSEMQSSKKK